MLSCLVYGASNFMMVSIPVDKLVYDLKEMVHNKGKNGALRDTDVSDLFVWKLKKQESIAPEESLGDRVSSQGRLSLIAVKLDSLARIGDIFPDQPSKLCLHILVQHVRSPTVSPSTSVTSNMSMSASASSTGETFPAAAHKRTLDDVGSYEEGGKRHKADGPIVNDDPFAQFGFKHLTYDGTPTDSVLHFHKMYWGNPLPPEHLSLQNMVHHPNDIEDDDGDNGDDLLPATPLPIIHTPWTPVFIRAEYLRMYNWTEVMSVEGKVYRPSAVVVTGQPGIGKMFWAYYILRRRLGEKSAIMWYQRSVIYLFCSQGVLLVPPTFTFSKFSPPIWTIIDSVQSPSGIPTDMVPFPPGVFPIYITSPTPERWAGISQSWTCHHLVMNAWTKAEITKASVLYSNQSLDDALEKYDSLGPTARFCFELTPGEIERHVTDRLIAIRNSSPHHLRQLFTASGRLSLDHLSHKICLIRRKRGSTLDGGTASTNFISVNVKQEVVQRLEEFSDDQLLEMWHNFSKFGDARGMTGPIFEVFVHRRFKTRIDLNAEPMVRAKRANSRWYGSFGTQQPQAATLHGLAEQNFHLQFDVGTHIVYDDTLQSVQPDVFYLPRSGQQVALDSFILHGGYLNIFQCTGSQKHDIKTGIYEFFESCTGLPPRQHWRFVFVIPDELDVFSCPGDVQDIGLYTARFSMSRV